MAEYLVQDTELIEIADAIRNKTGKTEAIIFEEIAGEIAEIETGIDTSNATAMATDIIEDKTAYVNGNLITGSIGKFNTYINADYEVNLVGDFAIKLNNEGRAYIDKNTCLYQNASFLGNATAADVRAGKTFTSSDGVRVEGNALVAGDGFVYPDGAFIPVSNFTDGKQYALIAVINGVHRYLNTTTYNNYTMNATVTTISKNTGDYVIFASMPVLFTAIASGNGFLLQNGSNYLHGTTSNGTALRVGTTQAVWTVDTSATGGFSEGKYYAKEDSNSVWLFNNSGNYNWCIKYETAGSFGYDRSGRDNTYSTGFVPLVLYEYVAGEGELNPVVDTSDATAIAEDILVGKIAYANGKKIIGNIPNQVAQTITPGTSDQTIASGRYLTGTQTIKGDSNLVASNIKKGVTIFDVTGSYEEVELNFDIVGGTSQPSNPKENTIWINTSTEISTYIFSAEQPESPLEGMVWIRTATDSPVEFNALIEGTLWIYPDSAKQYVSGAWIDIAPLSYLNGAWVDWINYLFKAGDTSGLSRVAWKGHSYQSTGAPSVSYASDGAYVRGAGSPGQNGVAYFDAIDLTNISKITFLLTVTGIDRPTDYIKCDCVGVWKTIGSGIYGDSAAAHASLYNGSGKQTYTLNVSGLSGLYYVGVGARTGTNSNTLIVIHEIILS